MAVSLVNVFDEGEVACGNVGRKIKAGLWGFATRHKYWRYFMREVEVPEVNTIVGDIV